MSMPPEDIHPPNTPARGATLGAASGPPSARLTGEEFARRYRESWRVLWCIAAGETGDRSAADDIVQQAALVALARLADFDPSTSFLAWMAQIVRYTAKNESQKTRRRRTSATDPASMDSTAPGRKTDDEPAPPISRFGHLVPGQNSFDDRLMKALETLDTVARSCLLMRVVLDTPYKEISLILGIPQGTAMSHVDRARRALRTHLTAGSAGQARPGGGHS
ncbi:MAG: hypothetical protein AMXMBFR58_35360 [Phycisphaerae bacterium]|nr:hypothetical protein [Phycisphaerales bacterium]